MLSLLRKIHQQQEKIDQELETPNEKLAFYKDFFDKYKCNSIKDILQIDTCDIIVATLAAADDSLPIEVIKDAIYSNRELIENLSSEALWDLLAMYDNLQNLGALEAVKENFATGKNPFFLSRLRGGEKSIIAAAREIVEENGGDPSKFVKLFPLLEIENEIVKESNEHPELPPKLNCLTGAVVYAEVLKDLRADRMTSTDFVMFFDEQMLGGSSSSRKKNKMIASLDDIMGYKSSEIKSYMQATRKYYDSLNAEENSRRKNLTRQRNQYEQLAKELYAALDKKGIEAKVPEKVIKKVPDATIRTSALRLLYQHNMEVYDAKEKEYTELSKNDKAHYQVLLAKYGLSPSDYEVGTIMNNSLDDVEKMLQQLAKQGINRPMVLLEILQKSNLETITNYLSLVDKGIIPTELLTSNLAMFDPTSKDYENIMRNLSVIKEKKINPHNFKATPQVLLTSSQRFKTNVETLASYDLMGSLKTGIDASFMASQDLASAIDTLLELGYEVNLEESLELLNHKDKFNRLKLLKTLNMPVTSTEELLTILTTDKFFVPDSKIEEYIYNAAEFKLPTRIEKLPTPKKTNPDVPKLEDYTATPRTYSFDGIIISKNKVARNLSEIATTGRTSDRLAYGVLKGSTLTDEEVEKIVTVLSDKKTTQSSK